MSDTDKSLEPMTDAELSQIEQGIVMNIRQPILAPRHFKELLRRLNIGLARIAVLEEQVEALKSKPVPPATFTTVPPPAKATAPTTAKKPSTLDNV